MSQVEKRLSDWEGELSAGLPVGCRSWGIRCYDSVASTMDVAKAAVRDVSEARPGIFLTRHQTKGRGRQGRSWLQSHDALYVTYAFSVSGDVASFGGFSLVVGSVVRDILKAFGCEVSLKWPNDLVSVDRRKLGGILVETVSRGGVSYLLVGIGINLKNLPEGFSGAVSLQEMSGKSPSPVALAGMLAPALHSAWSRFRKEGFDVFRSRWMEAAIAVGENVVVDCDGQILEGRFLGVDERGAMLLDIAGAVRVVMSGHLGSSSPG